jgi:signal transduction histidine kinase
VSRSTRSWPSAVLAAALALLTAAAALALLAFGDIWHLDPAPQLVVDVAVGLGCPVMALVILHASSVPRGTRTLAWVLLGSGLACGLAALTATLSLLATTDSDAARLLVQLQSFLWVPGFLPLLTLVPLLYPDGLLPGRLARVLAWASVLGIVLLTAGVGLFPETFPGQVEIAKLVTAPGLARVLAVLGAALLLPACLGAVGTVVVRYRRSAGLQRRQVVVLLASASVLLVVTAAQGVIPAPLDVLLQALAALLVPVSIGVAVTRHRLYDLDLAVRRSLAVASLTVCLAGVYLSVFALLQAVVADRSALSAAVAAGVTGASIAPLASRLRAGVDRLFYGDRADPYLVSTRLAGRLAATGLDITRVPQVVADTLVSSLLLRGAEVRVRVGSAEEVLAFAGGDVEEPASRHPLRHRGETAGWLVVSPRAGEQALDERDTALLDAIADQVAPAIAALQLHEELQRSRESLVAAREAERLRLRQELHDGLGATLAGLRLQVESAQALVADPGAGQLLAAAGRGVAQAVAEVRSITEGLRPPNIDDLGLPRALEHLADRVRTPSLEVAVDIDVALDIAPAIEVAAYRITAEALANAARHARASRVTLTVHAEEELEVRVVDNGVGTGGSSSPDGSGLGVPSMRQRAEEVGGHLELTSSDAGTTVLALLPLSLGEPA